MSLGGGGITIAPRAGGAATSLAETQRAAWLPTGALAQTWLGDRGSVVIANNTLTSGTLRLEPIILPVGTINSISFISNTTAAITPTAQWFCLVKKSDLSVLAKTTDDTTTAWGTNTVKTLNLSASLVVSEITPAFVGIVVAAATPPSLKATNGDATLLGLAPIPAGNSTTGLTNPASLGATAAAISAASQIAYAYVS